MKQLLLVALFAVLSGTAHAVHPPSDLDRKSMEEVLAAARAANTDLQVKFQKHQVITSEAGYPAAEVQAADSAWRLAEKKRQTAANAALAAVIRAYDIHPENMKADAAAGIFEKRSVTWAPKFGEMATEHVYLDEKGKKIGATHLAPKTQYLGVTWADGQIIITPPVLFATKNGKLVFSPGMIAAIIYHETVHFNQLTTPIKAHMTGAQMEFAAHTAMESHQNDFQLTTDEMGYISDTMRQSLEQNLSNPNVMMIGPVSLDPTAGGELDSEVAQEIKRAQEEKARQKANQDADEDLRTTLAGIAVRFCSGDGSVDEATLDALPIQNHDRFLNGKMPKAVAAPGCPRKIFMTLGLDLARGRRPTMEEIGSVDIQLTAAPVRPPQFPELKPAASPEIPAAAALPPILPRLRQLAIDYCDSPGSVSDARLQSFAAYAQDIGGQYWPENYQSGQNGLSSCADEILRQLILVGKSGRWWSNGLTRETLQSFVPPPPPPPAPLPPPRPERVRRPTRHCAASQGGACVWTTD